MEPCFFCQVVVMRAWSRGTLRTLPFAAAAFDEGEAAAQLLSKADRKRMALWHRVDGAVVQCSEAKAGMALAFAVSALTATALLDLYEAQYLNRPAHN